MGTVPGSVTPAVWDWLHLRPELVEGVEWCLSLEQIIGTVPDYGAFLVRVSERAGGESPLTVIPAT